VCVCYLVSYHMVDFEEKNCFEGPNVGATIYAKLLLYISSLCALL